MSNALDSYLQSKKSYGPCGCMGKQGDEASCPCEMRARGLERTFHTKPITEAEKELLLNAFGRHE